MINSIKIYIFILPFVLLNANENNHTAIDVMKKVLHAPKPTSSISEINLEIVRKKMGKTKSKTRAFFRYDKQYNSGNYSKKSLVKFLKPKSIYGTGLLTWIGTDGSSDQWFFLPKLKVAKRVKSKEKGKSFMSTDFIYEDLESRKTGQDSLVLLRTEYLNGKSCQVILILYIRKLLLLIL